MGLILSEREVGRPCLCGAIDCRSCGPAQGHYPAEDDGDDGDDDADAWAERRRDDALTERDEAQS